jgi:hypothetical protein
MEINIKDITNKESLTAKENINGVMEAFIRVILSKV